MIRYFLENRISAIMLCTSIITAGVISLSLLPVSLMPGSDYPAVSVVIEYPGISPDKIEELITKPVERIIRTVSGITEIESVSEEGKSRINITFQNGTDIKIASLKIRGKVGLIKDSFPREVQEPVVMRYDPSERPVIAAAAEISGVDRKSVREIMEKRVKPALQRIEGISEIIIAGGELEEIHVEIESGPVLGRGLIASDISAAVSSGNISIPAGTIRTVEGNSKLYIPSGYRSLGEIRDSIIFCDKGRGIRVGDIASVRYGSREKENLSRYNGRDMLTLYIHRGGGANTLELCRSVLKVFKSFPGVQWRVIFNHGERIEASVNNAVFSGLWGIFIVSGVLFLFYRRRESVIPVVISIPSSIVAVPAFLYMAVRWINIMTISGFALSAGMVVDNGIVVIDAIKGKAGLSGSIPDSVNRVKLPLISSTFTTIAVFIPVMLLSDKTGLTYGDMAFTISAALLVSLFFAIVLLPAFYSLIKPAGKESLTDETVNNTAKHHVILSVPGKYRSFLYSIQDKTGDFLYSLEKVSLRYYKMGLNYSFEKSFRVIAIAGVAFFTALGLLASIGGGVLLEYGAREFYIYLEFPTGTSLEKTDRFVSEVEKMVTGARGVAAVSSKTEKWRGTLTVKTEESVTPDERKGLRLKLESDACKMIKDAGAFAYISDTDEASCSEVSIHFTGDDMETLKRIARTAAGKINSIEGIDHCLLRFREGRPEYTIAIDRCAAARADVSHASIVETIRNSLFGPVITKYIEKGREVDVRLRTKESDRDSIEKTLSGSVRAGTGVLLPVSEVVRLAVNKGLTRIFRLNGRRSCSITARAGVYTLRKAERLMAPVLSSLDMPEGYSFHFDRSFIESMDERGNLFFAAGASVLLIYMILASLFESFTMPLIVMTTLPFAVTGVAPVLFAAGIPLSPSVFMGLIMLAGIVMNNGILLVDSVRRASEVGCDMLQGNYKAIKDVAHLRFRPVMLTAVTTVLGLLPMVLGRGQGSSLWRPFALTVTSGLIFSTVLTLVILPVICGVYYQRKSEVV